MTTGQTESRFRWLVGLAVVGGGLLAYSNALTAGFVWDDASSVLLHEHVKDPSQFRQLFREDQHPFGRGQGNFYRPLVAASFMLDFAVAKAVAAPEALAARIPDISPFVFHKVNVLWHLAVSLLLFALLTRLGAPRFVRALVPLLYAVHPLHTEAVTYISGRADPMAAAFVLTALFFALDEGSPARRITGAVLSSVFFVLALLSKESATIYPFLLLLFVVLRPIPESADAPRDRVYLRRLVPLAASIVIVAVYAYLRFTLLHFGDSSAGNTAALGRRLLEMGQAFALYVRLIFLPTGLHMERSFDHVSVALAAVGYLLLLVTLGVFAYGWRSGRYRLALAVGWFLVTWFPISGLIPLNAPMSEHWMYLPLAGFLWALLELLTPAERPVARPFTVILAYAVCLVFIALTVDRNRDWKDNVTIYEATLRGNPNSMRVHYNLAVTYDEILKNNPAGARRHYERVIEIAEDARRKNPDIHGLGDEELEAHVSLGNILLDEKRFEQAAAHYQVVLGIVPDDAHAPLMASAAYGLGKVLLARGEIPAAFQNFQVAVQVRPDLGGEIREILQSVSLMGPS